MSIDSEALQILDQVIDLPPDEREAKVGELTTSEACRTQVLEMLSHDDDGSFLEGSVLDSFPALCSTPDIDCPGYEIIRELGRGGMGRVYLARDRELDRFVALKMISGAHLLDERSTERLRRESRAAAKLDHPGIVSVYSFHADRSRAFLVSAYIEGESLASRIERIRSEDPAHARSVQHVRWCVELIRKVASATEYAHSQGVLHRDIKPSNILLDDHDTPHLADFGISRIQGDPEITKSQEWVGSLHTVSPEQAGAIDQKVGPATDIYALGCTLYHCLTLEPAFRGSSLAELIQGFDVDPPDARAANELIPASLARVCQRAMERTPSLRYESAAAFANAAMQALEGRPTETAYRLTKATRVITRRKMLLATMGSAALAAVGVWQFAGGDQTGGRLVMSAAGYGSVIVRPLDLVSEIAGDPIAEWSLPLDRPMESGRYRLVLMSGGVPAGELEVAIAPGSSHQIDLGTYAQARTLDLQNMAFIPAMPLQTGASTSRLPDQPPVGAVVEPFYIDRTPVSNAEYMAFVNSSGHPAPPWWPDVLGPDVLGLPVVGVTLADATAYARWAGKRLPTSTEWDAAFRGPEGRLYPWGDDASMAWGRPGDEDAHDALMKVPMDSFESAQAFWPRYMELVDQLHPEWLEATSTPRGVLMGLGGVSEWTTSPIGLQPTLLDQNLYVIRGKPWAESKTDETDLTDSVLATSTSRIGTVGFRCVISDSVLP